MNRIATLVKTIGFIALLLSIHNSALSQTITISVRGTNLGYTEGGCGDCVSGPDPRWRSRMTINAVNYDWNVNEDDIASCGLRGHTSPSWVVGVNVPSTSTLNLQFNGFESDGFVCGADDANCGGYATINGAPAATALAPCTTHSFTNTRTCSSDGTTGTYTVVWNYDWYWSTLPASGAITGNQTICAGGDPTIITSTGGTNPAFTIWQWQYADNCGGVWIDIAGANAADYDPPAGLTNTRCYRRVLKADQLCNIPAEQITNVVTVTVNTLSVAPTSATASPTTICEGASSTLSVVGGSLGTGATWQWYSGSCGGTAVGTGTSLSVSPVVTTTYFVRAEGTCNTTACAQVTVTVESASTAPAGANISISAVCSGSATDLTVSGGALGTGANWVWYSGSCGGTLVGNGSPLTVNPSVSTTYFVRAEGSCNTTACQSVSVTVEQPSNITNVTATPASFCAPGSSTLTITGSLGTGAQWEIYTASCGGTLEGTTTLGNYAVSPAATTTYHVLGSASTGGLCAATTCIPVVVTVQSASVAPTGVIAGSTLICAGATTTLSVDGGVLGTGATWEWYSGSCGGVSLGAGASINVSPTATTTYFVRAESACGNTTCASVTINVETPSTLATVNASPVTLCGAGNSDLIISGSLGTGAQWQIYTGSCGGTLLTTSSTSPVNVAVASTTTYYVQASATTMGACPATSCELVAVNVNTPPTAPTSASATATTICVGGSTQLSQVGGSAGSGGTFEWYTGSCGGASAGTGASINVSPTVTTTYYVRAESPCGITTCESITITVNTPSTDPTSATAATPTFCLGGNTNLSVFGGTVGTTADYVWYTGGCGAGAPIGTGSSINVAPTTTTTYFVRLEGDCNNTNCQPVTVTVEQPSTDPAAIVASQTSLCPGQNSILTVTGGSLGTGASWQWYEASCGGAPVGTGTTISVSPVATTTYYVRAEGTCNTTNCHFVTITIGTGATAPTSADLTVDNICPGDTTEIFQLGGSIGSGDVWVWYTGACGAVTVGVGETLAVAPTVTTTYYVRAVGNCGATLCASVTVNVVPGSVKPTGITASANNFCRGASTTLTVQGGSLVTGANWTWYANSCGGGVSIGTGNSITVTPASASSYFVRAEGGSCGNTECASIFINVLGTDAYFVFVDTICGLAAPFNLTGGLPAGGAYSGAGVSAGTFSPVNAGVGTHTLTYNYTDANGCTAVASTNVTVTAANLAASASVVPKECSDGGVTIYVAATGGDGNYSYNWNTGASGNPLTYLDAGTYSVAVSDGSGCGTFVDNIVVAQDQDCIQMPNSFTPNADGVNDTWNLNLAPYGGASSVQVFSKWGQVVMEMTNVSNLSWDGTWNGKDLPSGTYYYIIILNDTNYGQQTGPVTIVR